MPAVADVLEYEIGEVILPAPVSAEVDYLIGRRIGRAARTVFLRDLADGKFRVECLQPEEYDLIRRLDGRYADLDVGLADLSVVILAHRFRTRRILTFDERHFRTLRPLDGGAFTLLPPTNHLPARPDYRAAGRANVAPRTMQNIYDDPRFFAAYRELRDARRGINEAIEQPALRRLLPPLDGIDILDLGCVDGELARWCVERGARRVVGLELSARMLALARERTTEGGVLLVRTAIEQAAFVPTSFDLVVSSFALHYVADYAGVVHRAFEWLRPGGRIVFSVEHPVITAQVAKQGWVADHVGRRLFWALDDYADEGERRQRWFVDGVLKQHRRVATYVNGLLDAGFLLERLDEPEPLREATRDRPDLVDDRRRPPILVLAARKPPTTRRP